MNDNEIVSIEDSSSPQEQINASETPIHISVDLGRRSVKYYPLSEAEIANLDSDSFAVTCFMLAFTCCFSIFLLLGGFFMTGDAEKFPPTAYALVSYGTPFFFILSGIFLITVIALKSKSSAQKKDLLDSIGRRG